MITPAECILEERDIESLARADTVNAQERES
jgi:hypothetical protein